jgi:hypothetical protein
MSLPPHDPLPNARRTTIGIVLPMLDLGLADEELGLIALRDVAERTLGSEGLPRYLSYRVRVGVK